MAWSVLKIPELLGLWWIEVVGSVLLVVGFAAAGVVLWRRAPATGSATAAVAKVDEHGHHATAVGVGVEQS